jgi:hypothetical protein
MTAPSPHAQLWRWDIEKWIRGLETGPVSISGPLTLTNGSLTASGHILPSVTNTYDVGSATLRWRTVYTADLSLKNDIGDWTIVEGEDDLFITNNRTGKRYKFALIEAD